MRLSNLPTPDVPVEAQIPAVVGAHFASIGALMASFMGWLPAVVAVIPALYYAILIWESRTVQHYVANRRMVWRARKLARLKAKEKVITAKLEALRVQRQARTDARTLVEDAKTEAAQVTAKTETQIQADLPKI